MKILTLLTVVVFSLAGSRSVASQQNNSERPRIEWTQYEFDDGAMAIESPVKLEPAATSISPEEKNLVETLDIYLANYDRANFLVEISVLVGDDSSWTGAKRAGFYNGVWDGFSKSLENATKERGSNWSVELLGTLDVQISNNGGRETRYKFGPMVGALRVVIVGHRAYAANLLSSPDVYEEWREKFFSSFKINPRSPAATKAPSGS